MTLLDTIAAAGEVSSSTFAAATPIILNSDQILPRLSKPSPDSSNNNLIIPGSNWNICTTDSQIIQSINDLSKALQNPNPKKPITKTQFLSLLNSFFVSVSKQIDVKITDSNPIDSIKRLGFILSPEISSLIAEFCISLELWDVLEALIINNLLKSRNSSNLVEKLIEKKQSELLCRFVKHVPDLRSTEIQSILKYFLSPMDNNCFSAMISVRKKWEKEAISAMEKATKIDMPKKITTLAKEASFLFLISLDNFSSNEVCLHYLFGCDNSDPLVLGSALSTLNGSELTNLVKYFIKWLEKYWNYSDLSQNQSGKIGSVLSLKEITSMPSVVSILKAFGVVLDVNFSYWVLNPEIREEIKRGVELVGGMAMEGNYCEQLGEIIEQLRANKK
ncbi:hypothetical protein LUZ60_009838 [Juncus effusus]|nr:hypothetical protein LUZ60_009838 [Juncus effusus]